MKTWQPKMLEIYVSWTIHSKCWLSMTDWIYDVQQKTRFKPKNIFTHRAFDYQSCSLRVMKFEWHTFTDHNSAKTIDFLWNHVYIFGQSATHILRIPQKWCLQFGKRKTSIKKLTSFDVKSLYTNVPVDEAFVLYTNDPVDEAFDDIEKVVK